MPDNVAPDSEAEHRARREAACIASALKRPMPTQDAIEVFLDQLVCEIDQAERQGNRERAAKLAAVVSRHRLPSTPHVDQQAPPHRSTGRARRAATRGATRPSKASDDPEPPAAIVVEGAGIIYLHDCGDVRVVEVVAIGGPGVEERQLALEVLVASVFGEHVVVAARKRAGAAS